MPPWNALRALARVELRQLRRNPGRSLLVILLIAVPVAAMVGGSTLLFTTRQTVEEQRAEVMGRAALRVAIAGPWTVERALASLPEHARVEHLFGGQGEVRAAGRRLRSSELALAPGALSPQGLAAGLLRLLDGRAPAAPGEVALSRVLLEGLDVGLGDEVQLEEGPARVTGEVAAPEHLSLPVVLRAADLSAPRGGHSLLVDLPPAAAAALAADWRRDGARVVLRTDLGMVDEFESFLIFVLGSFAFFEAALVIAAAFAVSMRRRQREIGLLGSNGAQGGGMIAALLTSAATLALLGSALGLALGAGAARAVHPYLDGWTGRMNGPFEFATLHAAGAVALGVVTAVLAAALPARSAVRLPIRVALSGRRPVTGSSSRWLIGGASLAALGVVLVLFGALHGKDLAGLLILGGSILLVLGLGIASPWMLGRLAAVAGPLPLAWRLAVRDAGRFRARNGPVVTAVMGGMSVSVMLAALIASVKNLTVVLEPALRDDTILVEGPAAEQIVGKLTEEFSARAAAPLLAVHANGELVRARFPDARVDGTAAPFETWIACGDETLLELFDCGAPGQGFDAGRLVAVLPHDPGATAELLAAGDASARTLRVATHVPTQRVREPKALLSSARLAELGLQPGLPPRSQVGPWMVRFQAPVTVSMAERARGLAAERPGNSVDAEVLRTRPISIFYTVVLWICIVTGLVVIFVATALSSVESADDARVLHTVGAAPRLLRGHLAARAGYLALLGCVLAVPAGLMPMLGFQRIASMSLEFVMPWREIAITVLVMPVVAYAGTWLVARFVHQSRRKAPMKTTASFALLLTLSLSTHAQEASAPEVRWDAEPFVGQYRTRAGMAELSGRLGRITVPESRAAADGRTVELAFVLYETENPEPGPPLVYLVGGPGGSGTEHGASFARHPLLPVLELCDVIALDQRGTGLSRPNLAEGPDLAYELPLDVPLTQAEEEQAFAEQVAVGVQYWTERGVGLANFNTRESAGDIDDLRRALGLEKIALWGGSYGSHLGLAYLRKYQDHVERAVLTKVEGPDQTFKLPSTVQRHLEQLGALVAADPQFADTLPDLVGTVRGLLEGLEQQPVTATVQRDGEAVAVTIGPYDLQRTLSNSLGGLRELSQIPAGALRLVDGDWSELAEAALENRSGEVGSMMTVMMDCASGASKERFARITRESADPRNLLGDTINAPFGPAVRAATGNPDLGVAFRSRFECDVPVLFVTGSLDVRTPPENVVEFRDDFPNHVHVAIEGVSHDSFEMLSPEYQAVVRAFLRGEPVESQVIAVPEMRFEGPDTGR